MGRKRKEQDAVGMRAAASTAEWGASTALVVWLDVALDGQAPVERRCRLLGVEARGTGWRRSSAPGVRHFATVDGPRREPATLRVAGLPQTLLAQAPEP